MPMRADELTSCEFRCQRLDSEKASAVMGPDTPHPLTLEDSLPKARTGSQDEWARGPLALRRGRGGVPHARGVAFSVPAHLDVLFCQVVVDDFRAALTVPLGGKEEESLGRTL